MKRLTLILPQSKKNFNNVYERFDKVDGRFDRIEKLMLADHKRRIEKLEGEETKVSSSPFAKAREIEVKELKELLAVK